MSNNQRCSFYRDYESIAVRHGLRHCDLDHGRTISEGDLASCKKSYNPKKYQNGQKKDRRRYPRFLLELPLEYQAGDARNVSGGLVVNVSETGLLIRSVTDIAIGTKIEITILFPHGYELRNFKVSAEVIRKDNRREADWKGYEYGLRFLQMSDEDSQQLKQIIGGQLAA